MIRSIVYQNLRRALEAYAADEHSVELEIFAIEMEFIPGTTESSDPALLDEFNRMVPSEMSIADSFSRAADYVQSEIVDLRRLPIGKRIVEDLRAAAAGNASIVPQLRGWLTDG